MKAPSYTLGANGVLRSIVATASGFENLPKEFKDFSALTGIGDFTVYSLQLLHAGAF